MSLLYGIAIGFFAALAIAWIVLWLITFGRRSHGELTAGLHEDVSLWRWIREAVMPGPRP